MGVTLEEQINSIVENRISILMPRIIEKVKEEVRQEFDIKRQQTLFNQKETAELCNVSVSTFQKWRAMGLQSEASPTGKVLFDINKVNQWREENDNRKIR